MVRDYISKVEYIQALQYNGKNVNEVISWVGKSRCYQVDNIVRVSTNNSMSPIKLVKGDYIVKHDGVFKVLTDKEFNELYQLLPVGMIDSLNMMV